MDLLKKIVLILSCGVLTLSASAPKVTLINGTSKTLAVVVVRTAKGSKYKKLYVSDAESSVTNRIKLFAQSIRAIERLAPEGGAATVQNFVQNSLWDRALWIVPVSVRGLQALVKALESGAIDSANVGKEYEIHALEIGSSVTATVKKTLSGKFKLDTTGKWLEGAKALVQSTKNYLAGGEFGVTDKSAESTPENLTSSVISQWAKDARKLEEAAQKAIEDAKEAAKKKKNKAITASIAAKHGLKVKSN